MNLLPVTSECGRQGNMLLSTWSNKRRLSNSSSSNSNNNNNSNNINSSSSNRKTGTTCASGSRQQRLKVTTTALILLPLLTQLLLLPLPSNQVPTGSRQLRSSAAAAAHRRQEQITHSRLPLASPLAGAAALASSSQQQQQHPDAPKLVPLSALDRYQEGAELKLFCSAGSGSGRLHFEWRKNLNAEPLEQQVELAKGRQLHISMMDDSASVLRISQLEADDSGNYTCLARNQHGFDATTVHVEVNVRLKWIREPPGELQVRAGKSVQLDCDASGQPAPLVSWTSLKDHHTVNSKVLRIDRAQVNDSGLYECRASNQRSTGFGLGGGSDSGAPNEHLLRKLVRLIVNGK